MMEILFVLWLTFLAASVGRAVLLYLNVKYDKFLEEMTFSIALGYALFSFVTFLFGMFGLLYKELYLVLMFFLSLLFYKQMLGDARRTLSFRPALFTKSLWVNVVVLIILAHYAVQFVAVLAPPATPSTGPLDWDSLAYHLAVPKIYAGNHGFTFIQYIPHSNWPLGVEMLYVIALLVQNEIAARLISFVLCSLLLVAAYLLSRKFLSKEYSLLAVALLFCAPHVNAFFGTAYIDLALALYQTLSLYCFIDWFKSGKDGMLVLSALTTGFSASAKITGGVQLLLLLAAVIYKGISSKKDTTSILADMTKFALISSMFVLPWLAKTYLFTGNPVWPIYYSFFEMIGIHGASVGSYSKQLWRSAASSGAGKGILDLLLLPWNVTMHGVMFNGIMCPLFLVLAPLLVIYHKKLSAGIRALMCYTSGFMLVWFMQWQDTRFLFPVLPVFSVIASYIFSLSENKRICEMIKYLIVGVLLINFFLLLLYKYNAFPVALGFEDKGDYLFKAQSNYGLFGYVNSNLPSQSKVLLLNDNLGYYLDRSYIPYDSLVEIEQVCGYASANNLLSLLRTLDITHISLNQNYVKDLNEPCVQKRYTLAMDIVANNSTFLKEINNVSLYKIRYTDR